MTIISETVFYAIIFPDAGILTFLMIFSLVTLSDLKTDRVNTRELCSKLNYLVRVKAIGHGLLCFLLIMRGEWLLFFISLPVMGWILYDMASTRPVYDPTEIYDEGRIDRHMNVCIVHLTFFFGILFYLYALYEKKYYELWKKNATLI